ncbi:MAG: hypothetical protein ACK41E_09790 [Deinococcales bacterium]
MLLRLETGTGGFTGVMFALYCVGEGNTAEFSWFEYKSLETA